MWQLPGPTVWLAHTAGVVLGAQENKMNTSSFLLKGAPFRRHVQEPQLLDDEEALLSGRENSLWEDGAAVPSSGDSRLPVH